MRADVWTLVSRLSSSLLPSGPERRDQATTWPSELPEPAVTAAKLHLRWTAPPVISAMIDGASGGGGGGRGDEPPREEEEE